MVGAFGAHAAQQHDDTVLAGRNDAERASQQCVRRPVNEVTHGGIDRQGEASTGEDANSVDAGPAKMTYATSQRDI